MTTPPESSEHSELPVDPAAAADLVVVASVAASPHGEGSGLLADPQWHRLAPAMIIVHPLLELGRFLPALIGVLIFGSDSLMGLVAEGALIAVPVAIGVARYFTARYRVSNAQVELRHGLLHRRAVAASLDRVRSVELRATVVHRMLGLSTVAIRTGSAGITRQDALTLDAMRTAQAVALRAELLGRAASVETEPVTPETARAGASGDGSESASSELLVQLHVSWLRFAPFTTFGLVVAAAGLGVVGNSLGNLEQTSAGRMLGEWVEARESWILTHTLGVGLIGGAAVVVAVVVSACASYLVVNFNFRLSRSIDGSLRVRRGLLTTSDNTIDRARLRGVSVRQPLSLRLVGGGYLSIIAVGLSALLEGSATPSTVVPAAPRPLVDQVARELLGSPNSPLDAPLRQHPTAARWRRHTRAATVSLLLVAALAALLSLVFQVQVLVWLPWGIVAVVIGQLLAIDRWRLLGHTVAGGFLVASEGGLLASRDMLKYEGIVGWKLRASPFQRRVGLVTLTAATGAGDHSYPITDLAEGQALVLGEQTTPGLLTEFLMPT